MTQEETIKIEFTKDELYEIEKYFDTHAGNSVQWIADVISKLNQPYEKGNFSNLLFEDARKNFDMFRTISAKCQIARKGEGDKP